MINLLPQDGELFYLPALFASQEAAEIFDMLKNEIAWRQDRIRMYGKEHDLPRLQAWYGDEGTNYSYSGIDLHPLAWTKTLLKLKQKAEATTQQTFNSLLLNFYRSGEDYVSWHADDEKELGKNPVIASLSFGGLRRFQLKHRYDKNVQDISLDLEPGALVIMSGEIQQKWHHRIMPTKKHCDPRINLTFRKIIF